MAGYGQTSLSDVDQHGLGGELSYGNDGTQASGTGADGVYVITKNVVAVLPSPVPAAEKISISRGVLELSLSNTSPVKVQLFDVMGNLLKTEVLPHAQAGVYRLDLEKTTCAANPLIVRASIGEKEMTFRYLPLHNGVYSTASLREHVSPASWKTGQDRSRYRYS